MPASSSSNSDSGPEDRNPPPPSKGKKRPAESDEDEEKPRSSKEKKKQKETYSSKETEGLTRIKNSDGTDMVEIGKMRYLSVREFKGKALIDLREYYNDNKSGKMLPGKKGISLSREQYENFKKLIPEIDSKLKDI